MSESDTPAQADTGAGASVNVSVRMTGTDEEMRFDSLGVCQDWLATSGKEAPIREIHARWRSFPPDLFSRELTDPTASIAHEGQFAIMTIPISDGQDAAQSFDAAVTRYWAIRGGEEEAP